MSARQDERKEAIRLRLEAVAPPRLGPAIAYVPPDFRVAGESGDVELYADAIISRLPHLGLARCC